MRGHSCRSGLCCLAMHGALNVEVIINRHFCCIGNESVCTSALAFVLTIFYVLRQTKMDGNVIVPVILFILLTPGLLLSIPAGSSLVVKTLVHAVVFGIVYSILRSVFPQYY